MAKQKSFSTSPLNPFDKSQGAAAQFMPSQSPQILVANVEQQYQQQLPNNFNTNCPTKNNNIIVSIFS